MSCEKKKNQFNNIDITNNKIFRSDLSLSDYNEGNKRLVDFPGKIVILFFGYTQCPDICQITLNKMQEVLRIIDNKGYQSKLIQVLFVTIDPKRDTKKLLKQYVLNFHPSFIAIRPTEKELKQLTRDYKIFYHYNYLKDKKNKHYTIDHTTGGYVFDLTGRARLFLQYQSTPESISQDLIQLLNEA